MSFGSSFDTKEQVKRASDIVDLVGQHVQLQREGRGYKGLCPWHDDSRPSLHVNPERQSFKCWVCDVGGDVFSFVMKMENVAFPEALAMLAERAGIKLEPRRASGAASSDEKPSLYQAMAWAETQFHDCLLRSEEGEAARRYLASRGISDDSVRQFRLGYAPQRWDWLLDRGRQAGLSAKVLETIGLVVRRSSGPGYYDRFRGRVLFSIRDVQSRPVAVGGRLLPGAAEGEGAKYINSPETPLFSKSSLLYGLDAAREGISKSRRVLVVEGYTDCVIAHQCGFHDAVAVLGTALGQRHVRLLRRFADRIVLVLDGDEAGRRRTDQLLELFVAEQADLRVLTLPDELDPADFLLARGPQEFSRLLEGALDALDHKFRLATAGLDASSDVHQANRALEEVLSTLAKAPRLAGKSSSAAKLREDQVLHRLARRFGLGEERLRARLADLRRSGRPASAGVQPIESGPQSRLDKAYLWLVEILVDSPRWLAEVRQEIVLDDVPCPRLRRILECLYKLADEGREPTFDHLMLAIDDAPTKSLLVELDETNQAKKRSDAAAELRSLLAVLREDREARWPAPGAAAEPSTGEEEALESLRHIIDRKRRRLGISLPTDG